MQETSDVQSDYISIDWDVFDKRFAAIAIETYNVTIFEHGKSTFRSPQKERKGKLIVYNKNEIEFQIKAMKFIHKIKLKGPDFQFSNKHGEGRVDIIFEDALISGAVVEKFDGRKMVKSSKKQQKT